MVIRATQGEAVDLCVASYYGSPGTLTGTGATDTDVPCVGNGEEELVIGEPRKRLGKQREPDRAIEVWDQLLHLTEPVRI